MQRCLIKPCLKWAGGKRQLLPAIRAHLPARAADCIYYEPFVGAGALLFDLRPRRAVINDCNAQLALTYRVIRSHVEELIEALRIHQQAYADSGAPYYYAVRAQDADSDAFARLTDPQKAARLIFLNKTCYNGLYRVNSKGLFNVPHGRYRNPVICEEEVLRAVHTYLRACDITILCGDFEPAVQSAADNAFVYFDPPYHSPNDAGFSAYRPEGFDEAAQIRLRDTFARLTEQGALCLLSNADTPFIRAIYDDARFCIVALRAKRPINSDGARRGDVGEVLIKNWR